jgi:hypothetical protein
MMTENFIMNITKNYCYKSQLLNGKNVLQHDCLIKSGFFLNPTGIVSATAYGSATGSLGSMATEIITNPDFTSTSIINSGIEGLIGGGLVGGSTFLFTPIGSGSAGRAIGAMTSAPIDFAISTISTKYDLIHDK